MKVIQKFTALLFCLSFFTSVVFAQADRKTFTGVWELVHLGSDGSTTQNVAGGLLKIFNADGTFINLQARGQGTIITHSGKYFINDAEYYTEMIANEDSNVTYALAGKTYKIAYTFNEDKNQLTLKGSVDGKNGAPGLTYSEVWRKVIAHADNY